MRRPRQAYGRRRSGGFFGGRLKILLVALVGLAVYWFSNQQTVPFSGRNQLITVSIDEASQLGEQSYVQILQGEPGGVLCETTSCGPVEAEIVGKVRKIGRDLQRAAVQLENELLQEGYRFDLNLSFGELAQGELNSTVRIKTNYQGLPEYRIPVRASVTAP